MNETLTRMRLHLTPGIAFKTYQKLISYYPEEEIFSLPLSQLEKIPGVGPTKARFLKDPRYLDEAKKELAAIDQEEIQLLSYEELPPLLSKISDPPLFLYVKGELPQNSPMVTIVGTRRCSKTGRLEALKISQQLVHSNIWVVSGLAEGIDTAAHYGALATGKTVAVLGSGLKQIYPRNNQKLAAQIVERGGALVSEFPLNQMPQKGNFPRRNRILAGLAEITLLIEAPEKSGALITVDFALDYGREVFVVPGAIFEATRKGSNALLKEGASLCFGIEDLLDYYGISPIKKQVSFKPESPIESQIWTVLQQGGGTSSLENLEQQTQLSVSQLIRVLGNLEMRGFIEHEIGDYSIKAP